MDFNRETSSGGINFKRLVLLMILCTPPPPPTAVLYIPQFHLKQVKDTLNLSRDTFNTTEIEQICDMDRYSSILNRLFSL